YINVQSKGNWSRPLQKSKWLQLVIAGFFGIIPGCLGTYTIVSLYTHNIVSFGALVTVMISTFGDEAFIMFSMMPSVALKMIVILFVVGVATGFIVNVFSKKSLIADKNFHFKLHKEEGECQCYKWNDIVAHFRKITFHRAILLFGLIIFIFGLISGEFGHDHGSGSNLVKVKTETVVISGQDTPAEHKDDHESGWDWIRITFLVVSLIAVFIVATVPDHFLHEHLWGHIIRKHFLKIFLWTLAALALIAVLKLYVDMEHWAVNNQVYLILLAVLVGLIPESGPHLVFVSMFFYGTIPFSILLANSVVQDGHGALPLFAESKRSFVKMKLINLIVGLLIGFAGYFTGW
ncbi:MAG: putative manganese transporter, partial [Bacteroidota bacterium]